MKEILAALNHASKDAQVAQGASFVRPTTLVQGTFAGYPFEIACNGHLEDASRLYKSLNVETLQTCSLDEIAARLLERHDPWEHRHSRPLHPLFPFVESLREVTELLRGEYAIAVAYADMLIAVRSAAVPLFWGRRNDVVFLTSDLGLFLPHGVEPVSEPFYPRTIMCQTRNTRACAPLRHGPVYVH